MTNCEANIVLIKEALYSILKQINSAPKGKLSNDLKASASKLYNLVIQCSNPIERFYFIHLTCQLCGNEKSNKVDKLMKIILPSQPTTQSIELISDLISFAICHPSIYSCILDNMSSYLSLTDSVNIYIESWFQAESLAIDSPCFCSALLSRDDVLGMDIGYKLLAKWLHDLSKTSQEFPPVDLRRIIEQLFVGHRSTGNDCDHDLARSDLHFAVLTLIQSKRCRTLTNQFTTQLTSEIARIFNDSKRECADANLIDRFAQILSVAVACKVATITNNLRMELESLRSNQLIAAIIKWSNK